MNENWKECKLGDILNFRRGHDLPKTKMVDGDVPVAGSNGIIGYHNKATSKSLGITIGRSGNIGNAYLHKKDFWAHNTTLYIDDFKNNDVYFIYYFLLNIDFKSYNVGSAVPTLNRNHIHPLEVNIPPLNEQKAIAEVLSSLDDKIDLLHRQNTTLEEMAETLFRQWFVEEAEKNCLFDEIKSHVNVVDNRGKTPPNTEQKTNYPLIEVNALGKENRLVDYSVIRKYVNQDTSETWFRNKLQKYDTLISTVGSIGSLSMFLLEKGNVAQNVVGLSAKNISPFYLYQILKYRTNEILSLDIGGVQPSIKVPHLLSLEIPIPSLEKQNKFDVIILSYVDKMEANYCQIQTLETLRNTLLPKLMSGEIRVEID